jgi:hypothetical protein
MNSALMQSYQNMATGSQNGLGAFAGQQLSQQQQLFARLVASYVAYPSVTSTTNPHVKAPETDTDWLRRRIREVMWMEGA